ncbi:uncharacterized protein MONOS_14400 [Monocercomonoides exilis]|uniref:uncharacterized protein n=1 Tax=Monocercomonoides exilis TaxID=2049356 RepID=UPI00355A2657|nr:hypothetical protein MONOS_14400 [Monocercomonoides exilis]|eukprot:MONOS_14400.1-p1 / transcript=MONOS_14400.1 / gene=MONOS_14400 / organism=Monocercomonoides_exilis_PA203 / gene_product=unspecified product / transcript_product=unspecified product / location=Mono_scaffold00995:13042-14326(-) / protein_length=399 / sequence_SO=supercontig / SO=protein_coding / is_pseudo=false
MEQQTLLGYVVARRAVLYGGVVCTRCGAFSDAFGYAGGAASVACSIGGREVGEQADLCVSCMNTFPSINDLFDPSMQIWRSFQLKYLVEKLKDEVMGRGIAVCEVGEIVEKGLDAAGLRMGDVVLSPAAIALDVLEEQEVAEEGERGAKREDKREKKREKKMEGERKVMGMRKKADIRQHTESLWRESKRTREAGRSDGSAGCGGAWAEWVEENRRAAEEAADGSLGITSDGSSEGVRKDVEQVEMSANGLGMNEESGREGGLIDLEEEEEERDNKGLEKDTHNKAFPYPQKPKIRIHQKQLKKMSGDELHDTFGEPEKLPGTFCGEETLPLLQPLGEQREEGGEGKRGAAKHHLFCYNDNIRNNVKVNEKENKDDARSSQPQSISLQIHIIHPLQIH